MSNEPTFNEEIIPFLQAISKRIDLSEVESITIDTKSIKDLFSESEGVELDSTKQFNVLRCVYRWDRSTRTFKKYC